MLNTKLHAPAPRANRVHRQRLLHRLDAGGRSALALVSAPAGFGKSTLVGEWLSRRGEPSAWLSLDPGDSDLRRSSPRASTRRSTCRASAPGTYGKLGVRNRTEAIAKVQALGLLAPPGA